MQFDTRPREPVLASPKVLKRLKARAGTSRYVIDHERLALEARDG